MERNKTFLLSTYISAEFTWRHQSDRVSDRYPCTAQQITNFENVIENRA